MSTRRPRLVTVGAALCLLVAACSDDAADTAATDAPDDTAIEEGAESTTELAAAGTAEENEDDEENSDAVDATTGEPRTTTEPTTGGGPRALSDAVAMTMTIDLHPDAVWEDGTAITAADLECTWRANLHTPGSIATAGYDRIIDVSAGESDKQVVVEFSSVYGPYKTLFNPVLKAASVARLRRRLGRVRHRAAGIGPGLPDRVVERERGRARSQRELLGRRAAGRPGRRAGAARSDRRDHRAA